MTRPPENTMTSPNATIAVEDLYEGMMASLEQTVSQEDVARFAEVTGDSNPLHFDAGFAATTVFGAPIAHGILSAGYISAVIGTRLPGPGTIYLSQQLKFRAPVRIGDTVTARHTRKVPSSQLHSVYADNASRYNYGSRRPAILRLPTS